MSGYWKPIPHVEYAPSDKLHKPFSTRVIPFAKRVKLSGAKYPPPPPPNKEKIITKLIFLMCVIL